MDTSVSGTVTRAGPLYRVTLRAAGLTAGSAATLQVVTDRVVIMVAAGCRVDERTVRCQVSAADPTVTMTVVAPNGATVTATLPPAADDPDPANNSWRAVLG